MSHETIYRSLFVQAVGELRRELATHLRTRRTSRSPQGSEAARGTLAGMVSIRHAAGRGRGPCRPRALGGRPADGRDRQGAVITLVERSTRFVLLAPLPGHA
ncbi:MAG: hypothetical protein IPO93_13780 [Actinobacteria bacterium]|nr:hypothetical protein [Actinomycetota bacterium]